MTHYDVICKHCGSALKVDGRPKRLRDLRCLYCNQLLREPPKRRTGAGAERTKLDDMVEEE